MKEVLLYHDDADGIASAAVFLTIKGREMDLRPVSSEEIPNLSKIINKFNISGYTGIYAVDLFTNSQHVDIVYDHHNKEPLAKKIIHDPHVESCASILVEELVESLPLYKFFTIYNARTVQEVLNIIDTASYENPRYPFESDGNIARFYRLTEFNDSKAASKLMVSLLYKNNLNIKKMLKHFDHKKYKIIANNFGEQKIEVNGNIAISSGDKRPIRFSEYYLHPKVNFSITTKKLSDTTYGIYISKNPWNKIDKPANLAEVAEDCPWAITNNGHDDIAFLSVNKEKLDDTIKSLINILERGGI